MTETEIKNKIREIKQRILSLKKSEDSKYLYGLIDGIKKGAQLKSKEIFNDKELREGICDCPFSLNNSYVKFGLERIKYHNEEKMLLKLQGPEKYYKHQLLQS